MALDEWRSLANIGLPPRQRTPGNFHRNRQPQTLAMLALLARLELDSIVFIREDRGAFNLGARSKSPESKPRIDFKICRL